MANKTKTNEQALRSLLKALTPVESALVRERLVTILQQTSQSVQLFRASFSLRGTLGKGKTSHRTRLMEKVKHIVDKYKSKTWQTYRH